MPRLLVELPTRLIVTTVILMIIKAGDRRYNYYHQAMNTKNVLITGGADGLGRELALRYAEAGFRVTVLDVDQVKGNELHLQHGDISFLPFDLSTFTEMDLSAVSGPYDIVICNAGISISGNFLKIPFAKERDVFEVNVLGHINLIKLLLRLNKIAQQARLAFILSGFIYLPFPIAIAYSASKFALEGFARALETYLLGEKISVTRIYPGPMKTNHQKKYYQDLHEDRGVEPRQITPAIMRAIARRKRKVFPDTLSKLFHIGSVIFPGLLFRLSYLYCRRYEDKLW